MTLGKSTERGLLPTPNSSDCYNENTKNGYDKKKGYLRGALTSSRAGSPVSHSARQESGKAEMMTATCGRKCYELLKIYSPDGLSVKTLGEYLLLKGDWSSSKCALTWKEKTTPFKRLLFQLAPSTLRTAETESGLLRTPDTGMDRGPRSAENLKDRYLVRKMPLNLNDQIAMREKGLLPTANAHDGHIGYQDRSKKGGQENVETVLRNNTGGKETGLKLQPNFVEWMMGYPKDYTRLTAKTSPKPDIGSNALSRSETASSPKLPLRSCEQSRRQTIDYSVYAKSKVVAIDTETTGLNWRKDTVHCVSFSNGAHTDVVLWKDLDKAWLDKLLANPDVLKVFANSKFDIHMLRSMFAREGVGMVAENVMDVQFMAKMLDENLPKYHLKDLAHMYIDKNAYDAQDKVKDYIKEHLAGVFDSSKIPDEVLFPYAKKDAFYTYKLWELFNPAVQKDFSKLYELEKALIPVIVAMERRGVPIDTEYLANQGKAFNKLLAPVRRKLKKYLGNINYNSGAQIAKVLALKGIDVPITEKGNPCTNKEALEGLKHPVGELLLEYRKATYLKNLYCTGVREIAEDGVIYTSYSQMGCRTGRFSCSEPNLQNIEQKYGIITKGFPVRKGYRNFYFDYSQIEMRVLADYAQDENLLKAFAAGQDVHTATAARLFHVDYKKVTDTQRKVGKTLNFAISYGLGVRGLARKFKVSEDEARDQFNHYYSLFPAIKFLSDRAKAKIHERGYVQTVIGRRRRLPKELSYVAINAIGQGSAADVIKSAMIKVHAALQGTGANILMQIHDEIVVEIPVDRMDLVPVIKERMEDTKEFFEVPMRVDVECTKTTWNMAKKWKNT